MDILVYLVPIALILGFIGLVAFIWSIRSDQYSDLEGAAQRILIEPENSESDQSINNNP